MEKSAKYNVAQLVAEADGSVIVPTCNWKEFLTPHFRTIPSIKEYQHYTFSSDKPGIVSVKKFDTSSKELHLLKDNWNPGESVPNILTPKGLPLERQWYLYNNIRQFCPEETKDVVCLLPSIPLAIGTSQPGARTQANPRVADTITKHHKEHFALFWTLQCFHSSINCWKSRSITILSATIIIA